MVENLLEYINKRQTAFTPEEAKKEEKRKSENQISVFNAYYKLSRLNQDYQFIEKNIIDKVRSVEKQLALAGFDISGDAFRKKSVLSSERVQAFNNLVEQFNKKYKGVRSLPTTSQITSQFISEQREQLAQQYDFNNQGFLKRVGGFATQLGYGVVHDATKHPFLFTGGILLGGAVGGQLTRTGGLLANKIIQRFAVDGTILATAGIGTTTDENKIKELLQEDKLSQLAELPKNFAKGGATGVVFMGATKGLFYTGKGAVQGLEKGSFLYKNYTARRKLENFIASELAEAPASVRAEIYDEILKQNPNSVLSLKDKIVSREQLKTYADGIINNDKEKINNVLSSIGSDFSLANMAVPENITVENELLNDYLKHLETKNITTNLTEDFKNDILGQLGRNGIENAEGIFTDFPKFTRDIINTGADISTERIRTISRTATKLSTAEFPEFTRYSEQFITNNKGQDSVFAIREKAIKNLYLTDNAIDKNITELTKGFSLDEIRSLPENKRKSAQLINKTNNQIKFIENSLSVANSSDNLGTSQTSGNSLMNNLRNVMNANLELETEKIEQEIGQFFDEIKSTISRNANSGETSIDSVELSAIYDAVKNTFQGRETTNTIGSKIKTKITEWDNKLNQYGFKGISESIKGKHLPNIWSPSKVNNVSKEFFVNQMYQLIDKEKIAEIALANGRPITDFSSFLGNMYDRIRLNYSSRFGKNSTGDLLFTGDRILVFKDGQSWSRANDLFGKYDQAGAYLTEVFSRYRKKLQLVSLGLDNLEEAKTINKNMFNAIRDIIARKEEKIDVSKDLSTAERQFELMLTDFTSGNSSMMPDVPKYIGYFLSLSRKAMLSTAFVTAFFTDQLGSIPLLTKSLGIRNGHMRTILDSMKTLTNEELRMILGMNSTYNRNALATLMDKSYLAQTRDAVFNFPITSLNTVSELAESRAKLLFGTAVEQNAEISFSKLNKPFTDFLKKNGITAKDWDIYRQLPSYDLGYGAKAKLSGYLRNSQTEFRNVIDKFALAEQSALITGSPTNTYLGRTSKLRAKSSVFSQILAYVTEPFISTAVTIYHNQFNQMMEFLVQQNSDAFSTVLLQLLFGGYVTYYAKSLLKGENPDYNDRNAILQSLMYSNVAGPYADWIIGELLGFKGNENPVIGLFTNLAKGNKKGLYQKLRTASLSLNPYRNVGLAGQIAQRHTIDHIFRLIDPEGYAKYNKRLVERMDKGELEEWAVKALVPSDYLRQ